ARREHLIAWEPGPIDWWTLNSDGSVDPHSRRALVGGLLRDNEGRCLFAYTMNLGACSITRAEMRGAIQGLEYAWDKGYRRIFVKLDSMAAINLLTSTEDIEHQHRMEVIRFRELRDRDWEVKVEHRYQEGNFAADYLASLGYDACFGSLLVNTLDGGLCYLRCRTSYNFD
ncbi:Putative ribonuclease H protein At1g65750, partial [Linum perenne]